MVEEYEKECGKVGKRMEEKEMPGRFTAKTLYEWEVQSGIFEEVRKELEKMERS